MPNLRVVKTMEDEQHSLEVGDAPGHESGALEAAGKYRTIGRLDQGGMAEVFLAVSRGPAGFNKLVVIKRLRDALAEDVQHRELFLDEARLAARLNHANIVQTLEVAEQDGSFVLAMEYLEGQPLSRLAQEIQKQHVEVPHELFARIISLTLAGLHYAHELCDFDGTPLSIVHRDVSPQNVFVTYDGQVKLVDFGIAKAESSHSKTQAGTFKGKAAYMAPEQLVGETIDRRADVFTTGIVLWEMIARRRLMSASSTAKTMMRIVNEDAPRLASVVPGVAPALDAIVARALARDPAQRFPTAQAMRDELEAYIASTGRAVRQEEIGALVSKLFSDVRERVQRDVKEQMAAIALEPASGVMMAASPLGHSSAPPGASGLFGASAVHGGSAMTGASAMIGASAMRRPTPLATSIPAVSASTAPAPRPRWPILAIVAALPIAALAIGAILYERLEPPNAGTDPASTAPVVPTATPAPMPEPAAVPTPAIVEQPAPSASFARPAITRAPDPPKPAPRAAAPSHATAAPSPASPPTNTTPPEITTPPPAPQPPPPAATPTQQGRKFRKEL